MPFTKKTRTGFLLLLVGGPFLVFLFLYLFGKNRFETDSYPYKAGFLKNLNAQSPVLIGDDGSRLNEREKKEYLNQWKRLDPFFAEKKIKPLTGWFCTENLQVEGPSSSGFRKDKIRVNPDSVFLILARKDTTLDIITAKGPARKRLPAPPRAFLFDENLNLRGVYGLFNSRDTDTLMLEFKILTNQ